MLSDEYYIKRALVLARRGKGKTSPNPLVAAVIVKRNRIVGEGYHRKAGLSHAEVVALKKAGKEARGAVLYVTIEPCCHYGRTPPCAEEIIKSGVKRVVAAMLDPNPLNQGRGMARLRAAGISTAVGVLEKEARLLNEAFIKFITKRIPYVTVKIAQSLDGKIATAAGDSRWISGEKARNFSHRLRSESDAVLVGVNTILSDDPLLTVRLRGRTTSKQPVRVILDSRLRIPRSARLFSAPSGGKVIIATSRTMRKKKVSQLEEMGIEVLILPDRGGKVNLRQLVKELAKRGVSRVLIEGGGTVIASALQEKLVDRVLFFIAPKIIGGRYAPTSVEGEGIEKIIQAIRLKDTHLRTFDEDFLIEGRVEYQDSR